MDDDDDHFGKLAETVTGAGLIKDGFSNIGDGFEGFHFSINPKDFSPKKFGKIVGGTAEVAAGLGLATAVVSACNIA